MTQRKPPPPLLRRRYIIVEENMKSDDKFSITVQYEEGFEAPMVGSHLQFLNADGGYNSYTVTNVVRREVHDEYSKYDVYVLVSRTVMEWQPMSM